MSEDTRQTPPPTFTAEQCDEIAAYQRELAESAALEGAITDAKEHRESADVAQYAASLQRREDATCEWKEDEDGNWHTSCDEMFTFIDGKPRENYYKFCAHCGRHLVESVYVEPTDDEVQP
jgi:hypothetical protein